MRFVKSFLSTACFNDSAKNLSGRRLPNTSIVRGHGQGPGRDNGQPVRFHDDGYHERSRLAIRPKPGGNQAVIKRISGNGELDQPREESRCTYHAAGRGWTYSHDHRRSGSGPARPYPPLARLRDACSGRQSPPRLHVGHDRSCGRYNIRLRSHLALVVVGRQ